MGAALKPSALSSDTMRAAVFVAFGGPEVLRTIECARPRPGPGQLRVRVRAAGLQPLDAQLRAGRVVDGFFPLRFPQQLGSAFAGVVDALGIGIDDFTIGDEVLGWAVLSCHAEYVVVSPAQIVAKPPTMSWSAAGALSASGQVALAALRTLNVGRGDTLLVHGAAGGVGSMAVQLARRRGATVIGSASAANHAYLRELGALAVPYGDALVDAVRALAPAGVDAALDCSGHGALEASIALGIDRAHIATLCDADGARRLGLRRLQTRRSLVALNELVDLHDAGALRVHVRRRVRLDELGDAHRELDSGHGRGKLVLCFDDAA